MSSRQAVLILIFVNPGQVIRHDALPGLLPVAPALSALADEVLLTGRQSLKQRRGNKDLPKKKDRRV